jgi:NADPH:quinone reductase-like Zn-dependent oxidoreductase
MRLRREVSTAAAGTRTEAEFFTRLAQAGVLIRHRHSTVNPGDVTGLSGRLAPAHHPLTGAAGVLVRERERFSELNPGQVTGYAVALRGCTGPDGALRWYGAGGCTTR